MESKTITIEIKAPPDGWVYDGYRRVRLGEQLFEGGEWDLWEFDNESNYEYPVAVRIQPKWTPPKEWAALFGHCWMTRNRENAIGLHMEKPYLNDGYWRSLKFFYALAIEDWIRPEMLPPKNIPSNECCWEIGGEQ